MYRAREALQVEQNALIMVLCSMTVANLLLCGMTIEHTVMLTWTPHLAPAGLPQRVSTSRPALHDPSASHNFLGSILHHSFPAAGAITSRHEPDTVMRSRRLVKQSEKHAGPSFAPTTKWGLKKIGNQCQRGYPWSSAVRPLHSKAA